MLSKWIPDDGENMDVVGGRWPSISRRKRCSAIVRWRQSIQSKINWKREEVLMDEPNTTRTVLQHEISQNVRCILIYKRVTSRSSFLLRKKSSNWSLCAILIGWTKKWRRFAHNCLHFCTNRSLNIIYWIIKNNGNSITKKCLYVITKKTIGT